MRDRQAGIGQDPRMARACVHVHGGSALLAQLARANVPGSRLDWSEVLCDGPTPGAAAADLDAWYDLRAAHLAAAFAPDARDAVRERLMAQDRALAAMA